MRTLKAVAGHDKGAETLENIAREVVGYDVGFLTVFAFSTENWRRSPVEVRGLLEIMRRFLRSKIDALVKDNVRLAIIGERKAFDADLQSLFEQAEEQTAHCTGLVLTVALNYGGQQDLQQAAEKFAHANLSAGTSTEPFHAYLQTAFLPPVDMLIRTGGERRLSNFILWDLSYAELYFTDVFWPDFGADELKNAVNSFYQRQRRFGGDADLLRSDDGNISKEKLA